MDDETVVCPRCGQEITSAFLCPVCEARGRRRFFRNFFRVLLILALFAAALATTIPWDEVLR